MKKSTQRIIYTVLFMMILAVVIIYAYFQMTGKKEEQIPKTKVEKLINRNLEGNYPATPREVMKVYGELTKYLYNGSEEKKMSEKQFEALFDQVRLLYSQELLDENPREEQLERLKMDVADYRKQSKTIMSYSIQQSSQIEFDKLDGKETAKVIVSFTTREEGKQPAKTYERFLLQADKEERWKIVGWEQISEDSLK